MSFLMTIIFLMVMSAAVKAVQRSWRRERRPTFNPVVLETETFELPEVSDGR